MTISLEKLLEPGILGFFTSYEVTEIFATPRGDQPINLFTLLVAEEAVDPTPMSPVYLNPNRIKLRSLHDWSFGIRRYTKPITELVPWLNRLNVDVRDNQSITQTQTGKLHVNDPQFVPPDSGKSIPLNSLLKNNFWNGSYLFEWSDYEKALVQPFFEDSRRLQELSEQVEKYAPLRLARVSDRLGNFIVQIPVTVVISQFGQLRTTREISLEVAWCSKSTPRSLRVSCAMEFDGTVTGYSSSFVQAGENNLPSFASRGVLRGVLWDEENQLILAATAPLSFIRSINLNMQVPDQEPRTFSVDLQDGTVEPRRVNLIAHTTRSLIGEPYGDDNGGWTQKRLYEEQANHLAAEQRFVQYRPDLSQRDASHKKALQDVRQLIAQHGMEGVWLWDPYLSARDILETLFYCPYPDADLRGLSAGRKINGSLSDFSEQQRAQLEATVSNWRGLRLEYRIRKGPAGWGFHDRFLIFPASEHGALAWSLGTSIKSLGKEHHILQRVDNGQLVKDAFQDLWDELNQPEHMIWKKP